MPVERVYLIRHGETEWNNNGRWQGNLDTPLNDHGRQQARKLAKYLSTRPIADVYSSDLSRALETARTLADALGLTPQTDPRLRELHLGIFQGLTRDEIKEKYPQQLADNHNDYMDHVIPQGESRRQLQARMWAAWNDITASATGPEAVIVSHGGALKVLLFKLFEADAPALSNLHIGNTTITTISQHSSGWRITGLAAAPHLMDDAKVTTDEIEGDV